MRQAATILTRGNGSFGHVSPLPLHVDMKKERKKDVWWRISNSE